MKIQTLGIILIIVGFYSCKSDFKVGADYKDVTSVYSLLSMADTAHYVKINKGFFSESESNLVIAQNPDSLFFKDLDVKIEEIYNGNVVFTHTLTRVNLVDEGYIKDTGTFATSPNFAYKFKANLSPNRLHRLVVKNKISGDIITGTTAIINNDNFNIQLPKAIDMLSFADRNTPTNFVWTSPEGASMFDLYIRFFYEEKNVNTGIKTYEYKDILIAQNILAENNPASRLVSADVFYASLNGAFAPTNDYVRYVDTPDIIILAGGKELKTYVDVNSAQGGITADQIKPNYTNLNLNDKSSKLVFGIFSSRGKEYVDRVPFDLKTLDAIINGEFCRNAKIVGVSSR
jgi:hypothetical protein